jgi:hypothetical protein
MAHPSKGSRLKLGEPLASELADFCAAAWGAPEINIVRVALESFMRERLAKEPELRERYEDARKKRLGARADKIRLLHPEK